MALPALVISRVKALTPLATMLSEETAAPTLSRAIVPSCGQAVLVLEDVLDGEGVDVDDDGLELRLAQDGGVVVDFVLLRGDEQEIHLRGLGPAPEDLVVDRHELDVERNVLLGLPVDLLVELRRGHHRHGDLADDDALSVDADGDVALLDLRVGEDAEERLGHGAGVHDVTVDDRLRRQGREAPLDDLELLARLLELHDLDGARADIDADEVFSFGHAGGSPSSGESPERQLEVWHPPRRHVKKGGSPALPLLRYGSRAMRFAAALAVPWLARRLLPATAAGPT